MGRLLVVEDDDAISAIVREEAADLGYVVTVVDTVEGAKRETALAMPDVVVLDRMLADGRDGLGYIEWLNALEGQRPGVLVASRLTSVSDHVLGLECGADDYINKPFEVVELRARIRAVARRATSHRAPNSVLFFDTLEVRQGSRVALVGETQLALRPQSFDLLNAIVVREGEWVSRKALWHEVWTDYRNLSPQDTVINTAISRVRRALAKIENAPSVVSEELGYRLAPHSEIKS
ncbi:MAG: response regulator transcription factor [Pseudomonadota bacterium]